MPITCGLLKTLWFNEPGQREISQQRRQFLRRAGDVTSFSLNLSESADMLPRAEDV